ncbi:MAG: hypothetical protein ABEK36_05895 [Candidatus Aenigmatarchaeota archaeon]
MRRTLTIALFIGVSISSLSVLLMQFIPLNYYSLIGILYLYTGTAGITGYVIHNDLEGNKNIKKGDNQHISFKRAEGKWLTVHTVENRIKGLLESAEKDFIWLKHAFSLEKESKIIEDLILGHDEIDRIEVDNSLDLENI